jgi:hypothetical protein
MIVQHNYTPLLVLALVILCGAILLGFLLYEKTVPMLVTPTAAPTRQLGPVPTLQLAPTATPTAVPTLAPPTPVPPFAQTLQAIDFQNAVLSAQTTALHATLEAERVQATRTAIAADQLQAAVERTRSAVRAEAQETRSAQVAHAEGTRQAEQAALHRTEQDGANARETTFTGLVLAVGFVVIFAIVYLTVVTGQSKQKEAAAKVYAEQRRLLEVQTAVALKRDQVSTGRTIPMARTVEQGSDGAQPEQRKAA